MTNILIRILLSTALFHALCFNARAQQSTGVILQQEEQPATGTTVPESREEPPSFFSVSGTMSGVMQGHNKFAGNDATSHLLGNGIISLTMQPWSSTEINVSPMWMFGNMAGAGFGMAGNANALFSFSSELPFLV